MFKAQFTSYFIPQWFKSSKQDVAPTIPGPIPKSFTISNNDNKLINISMKEHRGNNNTEDEFIDISYKQLSYAEVAELAKNKKQKDKVPVAPSQPSRGKVNTNQFNALATEDEDDYEDSTHPIYETSKSDEEYAKSMNFKNKQYETVQKKKQRNSDHKKRWKEQQHQ
ncbi:hypothetical protein JA1_001712 [Spathaspora sp. JA1]|nr:hypothetical protein JA1_001712 [Spathaspora sp. JA1]